MKEATSVVFLQVHGLLVFGVLCQRHEDRRRHLYHVAIVPFGWRNGLAGPNCPVWMHCCRQEKVLGVSLLGRGQPTSSHGLFSSKFPI